MQTLNKLDRANGQIVKDGHMITFSGIVFNLMDPVPDDILLRDIAHGLAYNCRWNGSVKSFYSVAEHSIRVSKQFDSLEGRLAGLFHDAEEAYWGDTIRPLKNLLKIHYPEIVQHMKELREMIFVKFNIEYMDVEKEDHRELLWEYDNLISTIRFQTMQPRLAEKTWLALAKQLLTEKQLTYGNR